MYVKNLIKNLGGALKKLALQSYPMSRQETSFAAKTAAKSFSTYAKDYSTHEALRLQEAEDKDKQTEKTSTALMEKAKNLKLSEAIKDFKIETGQILNGAGPSSHSFPGSRDKSDFEKESGLTIEEFDELVEQGAKNKEDTHWHELMRYPLHLLPKKFHGKLLNYSIMEKNTDIFKQLIFEKGLDVNAGDKDGDTPLAFVADIGTPEMARILLEQGAEPEIDGLLNTYETAAFRAETSFGGFNGLEILKMICEKYPPKDEQSIEGIKHQLMTPASGVLHQAAREILGDDIIDNNDEEG